MKQNLTCPGCGTSFEPTHHLQRFHAPTCQRGFHDLNKQRGKVLLPLALAWRAGKRKRSENSAYAFAHLCILLDGYIGEDRAAGLRPDLIVSHKRKMGWSAHDILAEQDRKRRFKCKQTALSSGSR